MRRAHGGLRRCATMSWGVNDALELALSRAPCFPNRLAAGDSGNELTLCLLGAEPAAAEMLDCFPRQQMTSRWGLQLRAVWHTT